MTDRFKNIVYASLFAIMGYSAGSLFIVAGESVETGFTFAGTMTVAALLILVYPEVRRILWWIHSKTMAGETA